MTPAVGEIRINPFLFQLEIQDFSLSAPSGELLLGFGRLFVDFELSSIWHRAYTFANIDIDAPSAECGRCARRNPESAATEPEDCRRQSRRRKSSHCRTFGLDRSKSTKGS